MFVSLAAALTLAVQDPPPAPPAPAAPPEQRVTIRTLGGPGLDRDGDGFVSREEFSAPLTDHFGQLDKDGDGRLSTEEMSGGAGVHDVTIRRGAPGDGPRQVFIMDGPETGQIRTWTSADGQEVRVEAHTIVLRGPEGAPPIMPIPPHPPGAPGAPHAEGANVFIHRMGAPGGDVLQGPGDMDKDGDGRVTEAEFLAPLREAFARMDADGSGALEAGEREGVRVFTHRVETPRGD